MFIDPSSFIYFIQLSPGKILNQATNFWRAQKDDVYFFIERKRHILYHKNNTDSMFIRYILILYTSVSWI